MYDKLIILNMIYLSFKNRQCARYSLLKNKRYIFKEDIAKTNIAVSLFSCCFFYRDVIKYTSQTINVRSAALSAARSLYFGD